MRRLLIAAAIGICGVLMAADEITVDANLKVENGSFSLQRRVNNLQIDQTTSKADLGIQTFSQTATNALNIANVTTPHYCFLRSLDTSTSNAIFVNLVVRLEASDIAILPISATNLTAYTTNGNANLEYWINAK